MSKAIGRKEIDTNSETVGFEMPGAAWSIESSVVWLNGS